MGLSLLGIGGLFSNTFATEAAPSGDELLQRVKTLEKQVQVLEKEQKAEQSKTNGMATNMPVLTAGSKGFSIRSADSKFNISFHGLAQFDSRTFFADGGIRGNDQFLLRRIRPIIAGTVFQNFDFKFMPDFGGSSPKIQDVYLNYSYLPELQLKIGKFKSPIGLEYLQSAGNLSFNERSLVTDLVPLRDLGAELHGDLFAGRVNYAVGIFNGVADGANTANSDFDDDKEFAGRLFLLPLKHSSVHALQGLGFGVGGSYGDAYTASSLTGGYKTDGQQKWFSYNATVTGNGQHWRVSPQAYYYYGPLGLMGEYALSSQNVISGTTAATINNYAWQVAGSWVLIGGKNSYKGVVPTKPFNPASGHWGALELVARYARLHVDSDAFPTFASSSTSASAARAWAVGLNWWLNKNVRVMSSFSRTTFSGGTSGTVTKQPENVFFTRVQLSF